MPYSPALAATLSGASLRQLQYWRKDSPETGALLSPEHGKIPRVQYSYRDIVALRMFVGLRRKTSLQKIRRAVEWLQENHPDTHLSAHALESQPVSSSIVWISEDGDYFDIVEHPGQAGFQFVMADLFEQFETNAGRVVPNLSRPTASVSIDPEVRGGFPVIHETRIPFNAIASLSADGLSFENIRRLYPAVSETDVLGAERFAEMVREATGSRPAA